jgi:hypothetical protein
VSDATVQNIGLNSYVTGASGDGYGVLVNNDNATSGGGDSQFGVYANVSGVGVSTTTVKYGGYFAVSGDARLNYGVYITASGATTGNYSVYTEVGTAVFNANQDTNSDFQVYTENKTGLYVDASNDNIGIHTVSPDRALDVFGDYQFVHDPTVQLSTSVSGYGDIVTFGTGTVSAGNLYYLNGLGAWTAADADAESTSTGMLAIALGSAVGDGMLVRGYVRNSSWTQATGDILYVSQTAGEITSTAPSASGTVIRIVGYMINATSDQIYFNPSNDWTTN